MTVVKSFLDSIQTKITPETQISRGTQFLGNDNQFSKVLDSTNKSYNLSYEKVNEGFFSNVQKENMGITNSQNEIHEPAQKTLKSYEEQLADITNELKNSKEGKEDTIHSKSQNDKSEKQSEKLDSQEPKAKVEDEKKAEQESEAVTATDKPVEPEKKSTETAKSDTQNEKSSTGATVEQNNKSVKKGVVQQAKVQLEEVIKYISNPIVANKNKTVELQNVAKKQPVTTNVNKKSAKEEAIKAQLNITPQDVQTMVASNTKTAKSSTTAGDDTKKQYSNKPKATVKVEAQPAQPAQPKATVKVEAQPAQPAHSAQPKVGVEVETSQLQQIQQNKQVKPDVKDDKLIKTGTIDELKPRLVKLEVNQQQNANNSNSHQQGQNKPEIHLKQATPQMHGLDSTAAKINFEKNIQTANKVFNDPTTHKVNEFSVIKQVQEKLTEQMNENKSSLTMTLRPASLGKLSINIISQKDGVTTQITAESQQAKDILTKGLESLKQNLQEQGLNVNNIVVKVQEPAQSENNKDFQFTQNNQFDQTSKNMSDSSNNSKQTSGEGSTSQEQAGHENELASDVIEENNEQAQVGQDGKVDFRA